MGSWAFRPFTNVHLNQPIKRQNLMRTVFTRAFKKVKLLTTKFMEFLFPRCLLKVWLCHKPRDIISRNLIPYLRRHRYWMKPEVFQ